MLIPKEKGMVEKLRSRSFFCDLNESRPPLENMSETSGLQDGATQGTRRKSPKLILPKCNVSSLSITVPDKSTDWARREPNERINTVNKTKRRIIDEHILYCKNINKQQCLKPKFHEQHISFTQFDKMKNIKELKVLE